VSFLFTQPQLLTEAATNLSGIGSSLTAANSAAALPTTGVMAAGADEVSAAMAGVFGSHARQYQAMSAQAANLHEQFVQAMNNAGNAYAGAESANASPMQGGTGTTPTAVNTHAQGLLGGPPMGLGGGPVLGQAGAATRPGYRGGVGAGAPGRVGGYGGAGGPIGRGGAGGVTSAGLLERKPAAAGKPGRHLKAAKTFGEGGPGGVGDARDLGATDATESLRSAGQFFGKCGSGAAGGIGSDGLMRARSRSSR
jgi:hypothetical protein